MYTFSKILMGKTKTKQAKHLGAEIRISLQEAKRVAATMKEFTLWRTLGVDKKDPKAKEGTFPFREH